VRRCQFLPEAAAQRPNLELQLSPRCGPSPFALNPIIEWRVGSRGQRVEKDLNRVRLGAGFLPPRGPLMDTAGTAASDSIVLQVTFSLLAKRRGRQRTQLRQ
jgi:hypothetical protein